MSLFRRRVLQEDEASNELLLGDEKLEKDIKGVSDQGHDVSASRLRRDIKLTLKNKKNYSKCREKASAGQPPDEMFTVFVNSYKRHERMKRAVKHYRTCCGVKSVRIVWCEDEDPPPLIFFYDYSLSPPALQTYEFECFHLLEKNFGTKNEPRAPIVFEMRKNSLNSRFEPIPGITTEAVFHVDDDIEVPCVDLHRAFQVWLGRKDTLVGYFPRVHLLVNDRLEENEEGHPLYTYGYWWMVWRKASYSMILTKAAFLHVDFLDKYTNKLNDSLHDYVDDHMSCEDILMALLVAKESKVPPMYVRGDVKDTGVTGGISTRQWLKSRHAIERSKCISEMSVLMGNSEIPLIETSDAVPQQMLPSTWFEWFSGDQMNGITKMFKFWKR